MEVLSAKLEYFNSQPHKGADTCFLLPHFLHSNFNSQPHKGADSRWKSLHPVHKYFNSQPHKGADPTPSAISSPREISTHSPTRGLTAILGKKSHLKLFNL